MRLSYDKLVADYLETLQAKLRHFSVEPEFLGTWVHDEDDVRSIWDLFAAAQQAGCRDLTVDVGAARAKALDGRRLKAELSQLGEVALSRGKDGGLTVAAKLKERVDFAALRAAGSAPKPDTGLPSAPRRAAKPAAKTVARPKGGLHSVYRQAVAARKIRFEGPAPSAPAGILAFSAEEGGARLCVAVDAQGPVVAARHQGATQALRAVLDVVCEALEGRSIQEGSDHAVIRAEAKLRDPAQPAPVAGLLTARNADAIFELPLRLVRKIYRDYLAQTGAKPGWNFWDDEAGPAWKGLTPEERLARARAAIAEGCRALGEPERGVQLLEILGGARLVLVHAPATAKTAFGAVMMRLEALLKKALDPRIELQLESLEDRNKRVERTARDNKLL